MYKKLKDLRKSKKGFTLVELIVVLVILAILAAILVPALLGYIDKAREKQITTDANAALTAAQSILDEEYGLTQKPSVTEKAINNLTTFNSNKSWNASYTTEGGKSTSGKSTTGAKSNYNITAFSFTENSKTVYWNSKDGSWFTSGTAGKTAIAVS